MRQDVTRRRFLAVVSSAAAVPLLAGCGKSSDPGADREKRIKAAALVAVMIGERIVRFPHPALRILGVVLIVSGELVITYLALNEGSENTEKVKLTQDEAQKLETKRRVAFVREDGKVEERVIDDIKSGVP